MKKLLFTFFIPLFLLTSSTFVFAQEQTTNEYVPLAPIPGLNPGSGPQALGQYINSLYTLSIGIGAILAVLMIVVGGLQYMGSDIFSSKSAAKTRIQGALMGLGLLLASFLILNLINNDLVKLDVDIEVARSTAELSSFDINYNEYCLDTTTNPVGITGGTTVIPRTNRSSCFRTEAECNMIRTRNGTSPNTKCNAVERSFEIASDSCSGGCSEITIPVADATAGRESCAGQREGRACVVSDLIKDDLSQFHEYVSGNNLNGFVTEGFPPTYQHQNPCHTNGTCVDYDVPNIENNFLDITSVIESANYSNLYAVYETNNLSEYTTFVENYPNYAGNAYCGTAITGPHFSVYSGSTKKEKTPDEIKESIARSTARCRRPDESS